MAAPKKDDLKAQVRSRRRCREADEEEARQRDAAQALLVLQAGDRRRRQGRAPGRLRLRRRREARRLVQAQGHEQGRGDDRTTSSRSTSSTASERDAPSHRGGVTPLRRAVERRAFAALLRCGRSGFFAGGAAAHLGAPCGALRRPGARRFRAGRLDELVDRFGQRVDALAQRSTSLCVCTPSFDSARATRSSNTCSSLSHVPPTPLLHFLHLRLGRAARGRRGVARRLPRLRSSSSSPCFTSVSNIFMPSCCARENAPSPASQICCDESSTACDMSFACRARFDPSVRRFALAFLSMCLLLVRVPARAAPLIGCRF